MHQKGINLYYHYYYINTSLFHPLKFTLDMVLGKKPALPTNPQPLAPYGETIFLTLYMSVPFPSNLCATMFSVKKFCCSCIC